MMKIWSVTTMNYKVLNTWSLYIVLLTVM